MTTIKDNRRTMGAITTIKAEETQYSDATARQGYHTDNHYTLCRCAFFNTPPKSVLGTQHNTTNSNLDIHFFFFFFFFFIGTIVENHYGKFIDINI